MANLHPIIVHFPIALLTIYSLLEIASLFRKVRENRTVRYIKLFLVLVGWIFVQLALSSGESAEHAGFGARNIIELHSLFANISTRLYGIAAIGYALQRFLYDGITTTWGKKILGTKLHEIIQKIVFFYNKTGAYYILAIGGIAALSITGALGGAMVYGIEADPIVKVIAQLLHITQ